MILEVKAGKTYSQWRIEPEGERFIVKFPYNPAAVKAIKSFRGSRWNPDKKYWTISSCPRNLFQLKAITKGSNPYATYDTPLEILDNFERPLYDHQRELTSAALQYHNVIFAAEMGTGKTLAAFEAMERSGSEDWWWIGPKSALAAVSLEIIKWGIKFQPTFMTYERLVRVMNNWATDKAPFGVVFDESSKIKNELAQRSQACMALANGVREDHDDGMLILMTGSPAPKDPTNWWHQCEVACPGFLTEGDTIKLRRRLAVIENRNNMMTGGIYPHLVGWRDTDKRCARCGLFEFDHDDDDHRFRLGTNEVAKLYVRMKGLVTVKLKKDCLSLPEKRYEVRNCPPTAMIRRLASMIRNTESRAVSVLIKLRELSDGFQYKEVPSGETKTCPECNGCGKSQQIVVEEIDTTTGNVPEVQGEEEGPCPNCHGIGTIKLYKRVATVIPSPKYDELEQILGAHEEIGRLVIYASFSASIDRLVIFCRSKKWGVIRVDGRGWHYFGDDDLFCTKPEDLLGLFQDGEERVVFIGHPGSAGMGLTLTASPTILYFSNTFSAEDRIQSEDRIHRAGMDTNRGATIIDLVHLETDQLILDNLKKKRDLQAMTLGELDKSIGGQTWNALD